MLYIIVISTTNNPPNTLTSIPISADTPADALRKMAADLDDMNTIELLPLLPPYQEIE